MLVIGVGVSDGIGDADGIGCAAAALIAPAPMTTTAVRTIPANQRFIYTSCCACGSISTTEFNRSHLLRPSAITRP
jgi:hypothetical protein